MARAGASVARSPRGTDARDRDFVTGGQPGRRTAQLARAARGTEDTGQQDASRTRTHHRHGRPALESRQGGVGRFLFRHGPRY